MQNRWPAVEPHCVFTTWTLGCCLSSRWCSVQSWGSSSFSLFVQLCCPPCLLVYSHIIRLYHHKLLWRSDCSRSKRRIISRLSIRGRGVGLTVAGGLTGDLINQSIRYRPVARQLSPQCDWAHDIMSGCKPDGSTSHHSVYINYRIKCKAESWTFDMSQISSFVSNISRRLESVQQPGTVHADSSSLTETFNVKEPLIMMLVTPVLVLTNRNIFYQASCGCSSWWRPVDLFSPTPELKKG